MNLILRRDESTSDGVFGRLFVPGIPSLFTMEDDWKDNQRGESCIPPGQYELRRTIFHKHGYETFKVTNVPGRSRILIHPANTEEDVAGCIGIGVRLGRLWVHDEDAPGHPRVWKRAVVESRLAFERFMRAMQGYDTATLEVVWA